MRKGCLRVQAKQAPCRCRCGSVSWEPKALGHNRCCIAFVQAGAAVSCRPEVTRHCRGATAGAPPGQALTQIQSPLKAGDGCHIPLFSKETHACSSWARQLSCVLQRQLPARQWGQCGVPATTLTDIVPQLRGVWGLHRCYSVLHQGNIHVRMVLHSRNRLLSRCRETPHVGSWETWDASVPCSGTLTHAACPADNYGMYRVVPVCTTFPGPLHPLFFLQLLRTRETAHLNGTCSRTSASLQLTGMRVTAHLDYRCSCQDGLGVARVMR